MTRLISMVLVWAACAAGCREINVNDIEPGIYSLEIATIQEDCMPPRFQGLMQAAIFKQDGVVALHVPVDTEPPTLELVQLTSDLEQTVEIDIPACEGGVHQRRISVSDTGDEQLGATLSDTFAGLTRCSPSPAIPTSDCRVDRRLSYRELIMPCDAPCTIEMGPGGTLGCACPTE